MNPNIFDTKIEFLKGVGPQWSALLNKELGIFTYGDLIQYYPFRYEDRTKIYTISELTSETENVQIKGTITRMEVIGQARKQRLAVTFRDATGQIELVWFKGVQWMAKTLKPGVEYILFGKPSVFNGRISISHPEIEQFTPSLMEQFSHLSPVYHTTETLKTRKLESKAIAKMIRTLFSIVGNQVSESLPQYIIDKYSFLSKAHAYYHIHFPSDNQLLGKAKARLKYEELFFIQLKLFSEKTIKQNTYKGHYFGKTALLTEYYNNHLPFDLTNAQKRVIKEIREDFVSQKQMNRLLQGDVGSGKTIVAFLCALMAIDNDTQVCLMAPTEILAEQHYQGLKEFADKLGVTIRLLTGSSKKKDRAIIHEELLKGELQFIIGTHALLEDIVQFKNLGLCIIDEQHRFGVAQRAKLWRKNKSIYPHILVMTATPIPRTLAMTVYGELDVSVIDELPAGRKPIKTTHRYDANRLRVFGFMKEQLELGRQVYMVYPLIEESEKLDLKNLMDGYESVCRTFSNYAISIVHGKMKADAKEFEMQRFVKNETRIMVATTVIEVGVNVPNASVMVIENAERFGLAQLHQLRGRVGRGAEQSYCILMSSDKLSKEGRTRLHTMTQTNNGFEIADVDLQLRGPGDMSGTRQSGVLDLLIADVLKDSAILQEARRMAESIIEEDPALSQGKNLNLRKHIDSLKKTTVNWGRIS